MVLYIILAALFGARQLPAKTMPAKVQSNGTVSELPGPAAPARESNHTVKFVSGLIALASLIACFVLPLSVSLGGPESFARNHAVLKSWLIVPTLIYFVSGTVFYLEWRKSREQPAP